jgi:hypothetical protein
MVGIKQTGYEKNTISFLKQNFCQSLDFRFKKSVLSVPIVLVILKSAF